MGVEEVRKGVMDLKIERMWAWKMHSCLSGDVVKSSVGCATLR
jgi:hypothetical protein